MISVVIFRCSLNRMNRVYQILSFWGVNETETFPFANVIKLFTVSLYTYSAIILDYLLISNLYLHITASKLSSVNRH